MRYVELRQPTDIEALLVWTYRDQKADRVIGMGMGLYAQEAKLDGKEVHNTSACGVAAVERIGVLGTRVDGGGPSAAALHPDAEYVHEAVTALDPPLAILIMQHARAATRPDSAPITIPMPHPVPNRYGNPSVLYHKWDKGRHHGWCPIEWSSGAGNADHIEAEYRLWRRTLTILAMALSRDGRLTHHRAVQPHAPLSATIRTVR